MESGVQVHVLKQRRIVAAISEVNGRQTRGERVDKAAPKTDRRRMLEARVRRREQTGREKSSGVDRGY